MGDVVIKNNSGVNLIFHANKKRIKQFKKLEEKLNADGRDAYTPRPARLGEMLQKQIRLLLIPLYSKTPNAIP